MLKDKEEIIPSAYKNNDGIWIYPQIFYLEGKRCTRKDILSHISQDQLIQEAISVNKNIKGIINMARIVRCTRGYSWDATFYDKYKPLIEKNVGWECHYKKIRTMEHWDAVYMAVYLLLPDDEIGLYPDGLMPNGMYAPDLQQHYGCEYPDSE